MLANPFLNEMFHMQIHNVENHIFLQKKSPETEDP